MKVAIVHYWLVNHMRGGEKVVEALCRLFPEADIYTNVLDPDILTPTLRNHKIYTTFVNRLPFAKKWYQRYLPLMPRGLEALDLTGYDLVITSEAGPAKGVIAPPDALHICYCHSPMRYIWDQYHVYKQDAGWISRIFLALMAPRLRVWDVTSAARVDHFIANSNHVANRIRKYWRRESDVVYPPVDIAAFSPVPPDDLEDYYLWVGELASYKRPDLLIDAFNVSGRKLIVIGGPQKLATRLSQKASSNIKILGNTDFETLTGHMARCRALVFPGEEDFGIVPVEVMASGRPVIAYGRGGALDTVIDGKTGILFDRQTVEDLNGAIDRFETELLPVLDSTALVRHANQFREKKFRDNFIKVLEQESSKNFFNSNPNSLTIQ